MIEATWVGGPHDGQVLRLREDMHTVSIAMPRLPWYSLTEPDQTEPPESTIRVVNCPVRRTPNGYRIYWPKS